MKRIWWYVGFFVILIAGFWFFLFKDQDLSRSPLAVISDDVGSFSFVNQNGQVITDKDVEGKVYVAEYFFTTCKGICPKMNANMKRVFDKFRDEKEFLILSHTCMPETDSVPLLKAYETKMLNGATNSNWNFVTGNKTELYKMARQGYKIDNNKPDSAQNISDQFIHTQFFALVDKEKRVRGIYDGLKEDEIQKLFGDIQGLLKEKIDHKHFMNGFSNNPN
jgi:protein SCO1/2